MKTFKSNLFYTSLFICTSAVLSAQYHVNQEYRTAGGSPGITTFTNPTGIGWTESITDGSGNIITTGHTNVSGQGENMYIKKVTGTGSISFQTNINTSGTNNEYGIGLTKDASNNYYVVGTTDNGGTTNYDMMLWKFNSSGALQFSLAIPGVSGMNDVGTGIFLDASGNILVCGTSEVGIGDYDYVLYKYSGTGVAQWLSAGTYDYAGLIDVPMGITVDGSVISVLGSSASSLVKSDIAVARFNTSNGNYLSDTRTAISNVGYDQVYAFKKDANQNIYVVGKCSANGINYDMEIAKITSAYAIAWTQTVDVAGGEDIATAVDIDGGGDVIVAGYTTRTDGIKQMSFYKYSNAGSPIWEHHQASMNSTGDSYVAAIGLNADKAIFFIGGQTGSSGYAEAVTGRLSSNKELEWMKALKGTGFDINPAGINVLGNDIFLTVVNTDSPAAYETIKFSQLKRDSTRTYYNGKAAYKTKELIVRFLPSALNTAAIDNQVGTKITEFGSLSDFMTTPGYNAFTAALGTLCAGGHCDLKAIKIFDLLPTTYTSTTSRLGHTVAVPDFWATLLVVLPNSISVPQANAAWATIPSVVAYAHPNALGDFYSPPNDSAYASQKSLYPSVSYPNAHINVEEAWDIIPDGGRSFIKGGVFDTGCDWKHPDFSYDGLSDASSKLKGWNFGTNSDLKSNNGQDGNSHGTAICGIIGATRNNTIGVAGIAGGNDVTGADSTARGISLYSLRISDLTFLSPIIDYIAKSIVIASMDTSSLPYAYGLNFMSNSWGFTPGWPNADTNLTLLSEAVHFANRVNVTYLAARGNFGNANTVWPANLDDDWVLSVGGTGTDGNWAHTTNLPSMPANSDLSISYGKNLDLAAPSATALLLSTSYRQQFFNPAPYKFFGGSSGATPHVSGVVGLLMSYCNNPNNPTDYHNLAPEDCEFILQRAATDDTVTPGYDTLIGWGRLNAGAALRLVEKPFRYVYHFGTNSASSYSKSKTLYSSSDTVNLTERYQNDAGTWFAPGQYIVRTYEMGANVAQTLPFVFDSIMYFWTRPSSSTVLNLFTGLTNKQLIPHEKVAFTANASGYSSLRGYIYKVSDLAGNPLGWWPHDTTAANCNFEYSVLVKTKNVGINDQKKQQITAKVFPNPSSGMQTLLIESEKQENLMISIYDIMGRKIRTVYTGKSNPGETVINTDISTLANSLYIYNIQLGEKRENIRFIKE